MDSLSQSSAASSPTEAALGQPVEGPVGTRIAFPDILVRLALFGAFIVLLIGQISPASANELVYPLLVYGLLSAGYLLASLPPVAQEIQRQAGEQPLAMALFALVLLLPVIVYARTAPDFDLTDILFAGVLILLPTACVILNTPALRRADVSLGLITVALPLLLPFTRDAARDVMAAPLTMFGALMRLGAFLLPVLLLVFTTREQKQRLNFLFICGVCSLWYAVQFEAFPATPATLDIDMPYFQFAAIPLFLYMLALAGRFNQLGLSFQPSPRGVSVVTTNIGLFAVIGLPIAVVSGFLTPAFQGPTPLEAIVKALTVYLLIALPAEILFRGTLLAYLHETLRLNLNVIVVLSAVLFGASHVTTMTSHSNLGWYFALATIAGVFYARAFLATRNVAAAAVVHAAVNWGWWLLFGG